MLLGPSFSARAPPAPGALRSAGPPGSCCAANRTTPRPGEGFPQTLRAWRAFPGGSSARGHWLREKSERRFRPRFPPPSVRPPARSLRAPDGARQSNPSQHLRGSNEKSPQVNESMPDCKSLSIEGSGPVSDKGVIRPSGVPLLRKWQDFFRVRRHSGCRGGFMPPPSLEKHWASGGINPPLHCALTVFQHPASSSTVRLPVALGWAVAGAVTGFRRSQSAATAKAPRDILPISIGEATGRPKKMEATCIIDHKWPYNESLSAPPFDRLRVVSVVEPQSWGCLVLGRPPWRFRRVGLNKS